MVTTGFKSVVCITWKNIFLLLILIFSLISLYLLQLDTCLDTLHICEVLRCIFFSDEAIWEKTSTASWHMRNLLWFCILLAKKHFCSSSVGLCCFAPLLAHAPASWLIPRLVAVDMPEADIESVKYCTTLVWNHVRLCCKCLYFIRNSASYFY